MTTYLNQLNHTSVRGVQGVQYTMMYRKIDVMNIAYINSVCENPIGVEYGVYPVYPVHLYDLIHKMMLFVRAPRGGTGWVPALFKPISLK